MNLWSFSWVTHFQLRAAKLPFVEQGERGCTYSPVASRWTGQAPCPSQILQAPKLHFSTWGWQDWARKIFSTCTAVSPNTSPTAAFFRGRKVLRATVCTGKQLGKPPDPRPLWGFIWSKEGAGSRAAGLWTWLPEEERPLWPWAISFLLTSSLSFSYFCLVPAWLRRATVKSLARCILRIDVHCCMDSGKKVRLDDTQICFPTMSLWVYENWTLLLCPLSFLCSVPSDSRSLFCTKGKVPGEPKACFLLRLCTI